MYIEVVPSTLGARRDRHLSSVLSSDVYELRQEIRDKKMRHDELCYLRSTECH